MKILKNTEDHHTILQLTAADVMTSTKWTVRQPRAFFVIINKVTVSLRSPYASPRPLWQNIYFNFYTQISFISGWIQAENTPENVITVQFSLWAFWGPKQLVWKLVSIHCAGSIENVTFCHHLFQIRCSRGFVRWLASQKRKQLTDCWRLSSLNKGYPYMQVFLLS